jgi:hypothetical protein
MDHDTENNLDPVVLELAPLPRQEIGPFLLLGLPKHADQETIEASWAQRLIWARKKQFRIPLEDVNWAREMINDPEKRVRADVLSLNADTSDRVLERLAQRGGKNGQGPGWQPLDREKALAEYSPSVEVPRPDEVKSEIQVPDPPLDVPAALALLEQWAQEPLDPWDLSVHFDTSKGTVA